MIQKIRKIQQGSWTIVEIVGISESFAGIHLLLYTFNLLALINILT